MDKLIYLVVDGSGSPIDASYSEEEAEALADDYCYEMRNNYASDEGYNIDDLDIDEANELSISSDFAEVIEIELTDGVADIELPNGEEISVNDILNLLNED